MESQLNPNLEPEQAVQNAAETVSNECNNEATSVEVPAQEVPTAEPEQVTEPILADMPAAEPTEAIEPNEEEEEGISDTMFDNYTKQEVTQALEELLAEQHVSKIKKQVSLLRSRFLQLLKEDKDQALHTFLANDGNKEDFKYEPDEIDQRFDAAFGRYKAAKNKYAEEVEKEKENNLHKKQALLEELRVLVDSEESLKQIYDRFKEIQSTWKEIGAVPQANVNDLWQNYHFYVEKFFNKIKINRELRDLDMKKNLERKLEICEKTEALLLEPSIMKSFKQLQQYHQEWKESGAVEEDKKDELWNRFKAASDQINQKRKDYYDSIAKEQEMNYQAKLALCEQIDALMAQDYKSSLKQMNATGEQINELFKTWKTLGPAPKNVHDEIWNRFRTAMTTYFEDRKEYFKKNKEEQVNNYNLKLNLCMQAEAIALRKDWKKATADLLQLQQEWKTIGTVSRKQSEALWTRFRKACDDFFAAKAEFYKDITAGIAENLAKKQALIQKVKDYVMVDNKAENFEALKAFQREWTEIGYTAQADKDRIWEEFRAAIGQRFEELKSKAKFDSAENFANRVSEAGQNGLNSIKNELKDKIAKLSNEVSLLENNIGFFAHSKNADVLKNQFQEKINRYKDEIAELKEKLAKVDEEIKAAKAPKQSESTQE